MGEATEVALKVLAEKVNVLGIDRSALSKPQLAVACMKAVQQQYKKVRLHPLCPSLHGDTLPCRTSLSSFRGTGSL